MQIKPASSVDINAVLQQMRQLRDQVGVAPAQVSVLDQANQTNALNPGSELGFGKALESAIQNVNQLQQTAGKSADDFATGKENDLVKVMIDSQKASIGFQAMVQVRNRMVTAYQDIMNMPI